MYVCITAMVANNTVKSTVKIFSGYFRMRDRAISCFFASFAFLSYFVRDSLVTLAEENFIAALANIVFNEFANSVFATLSETPRLNYKCRIPSGTWRNIIEFDSKAAGSRRHFEGDAEFFFRVLSVSAND